MASNEKTPLETEVLAETEQEKEEFSPEEIMSSYLSQNQKLEELQGKYTRLAADFDNFRKRTERQSRDMVVRANQNLICQLLPIMDNFNLALDSIQDEPTKIGVKMIYDQLSGVLEREGLAPIEATGCPFDPLYHEAVSHEESEEVEEDIVIEEIRRGYMLGGKVLRPAMVKVNKSQEE